MNADSGDSDDGHGARLSAQSPWPGLASFAENDQAFFRGRAAEADELVRLLRRERLTVLFGRSGLGKSSLLAAGVAPRLREGLHLPVLLRIDYRAGIPPRQQVWRAVAAAAAHWQVEADAPHADETLWAYFHRAGAGFWNERNRAVLPVLVFDQFEELFTLGLAGEDTRERAVAFVTELADLVENRMPRPLQAAIEQAPERAQAFDIERRGCKVLISFREDFLAQVEGLRTQMPAVTRNRFRLLPMDLAQARAVVASGDELIEVDVAPRILGLAWNNKAEAPPEVEGERLEFDPALLSVICSELNRRRLEAGEARIGHHRLADSGAGVLADFYERSMTGLTSELRCFVEDELVTTSGYRDSRALDDALGRPGIKADEVTRLVDGRILRMDDRLGVRRLELTHDVLTGVVQQSRERRHARLAEEAARRREAEAQERQRRIRRSQRRAGAMLLVAVALIATAGWFFMQARTLEHEAAATNLIAHARAAPDAAYERQMLLGIEAVQRYPQRIDAQIDQMMRLVGAQRLESLYHAEAPISALHQEPAGGRVWIGTDDGALSELEAATLRPGPKRKVHRSAVLAITTSADGRVVASKDREELVVAERAGGRELLRATLAPPRSDDHWLQYLLALSTDGSHVAAVAPTQILVWSPGRGTAPSTLELGVAQQPACLGFTADGSELVAVVDSQVWRWTAASSQWTKDPRGGKVMPVQSSPDCQRVVLARQQGEQLTLVLADLVAGTELGPLRAVRSKPRDRWPGVRISADQRVVAIQEGDEWALFDAKQPELGEVGKISRQLLSERPFTADAKLRWLASASDDGTLALVRLGAPDEATRLKISDCCAFLAGVGADRLLAVGPKDELRVFRIEPARGLEAPDGKRLAFDAIEFNRAGSHLLARRDDGSIVLWNADGRPVALDTRGSNVVEFSPDGSRVAVLATGRQPRDATITVQSLALTADGAASPARRLPAGGEGSKLAISRDNRLLATGEAAGAILIREIDGGKTVAKIDGAGSEVRALAFNPSADELAAGYADGRIRLFEAGGKPLRDFDPPHEGGVDALAFHPKAHMLASSSELGATVLLQIDDARPLTADDAAYQPTLASSPSIAFVEDGRLLVAGDAGGPKELRDVARRIVVGTLATDEKGDVRTVALSANQRKLAILYRSGSVALSDWSPESLQRDSCARVGRNLSCSEWRQYFGDEPWRKTCQALPAPATACALARH